MKSMKKLAKKKIHFGYALIIIAALAMIPTILFSVLFFMPAPSAEAFFGSDVGLLVLTQPIKCVLDSAAGDCEATCHICGDTAQCNGLFEVKAKVLSGINLLYKTQALCLTSPLPPLVGNFRPGARCFGKYFLSGPVHYLFYFGCYQ